MDKKYFMYFKTEKGGMSVGSMSEREASFLFDVLKGSGVSHIETRDTIDDILYEDLSVGPEDRENINMYASIGISENDNIDIDCHKLVLDTPVSDKVSDIFKEKAKRGIVSCEFYNPSYDFEKILKEIISSDFLPSITDISGVYFVNHDGEITDAEASITADEKMKKKYKEKIGKIDAGWKKWHDKQMKKEKAFEKEKEEISRSNDDDAR